MKTTLPLLITSLLTSALALPTQQPGAENPTLTGAICPKDYISVNTNQFNAAATDLGGITVMACCKKGSYLTTYVSPQGALQCHDSKSQKLYEVKQSLGCGGKAKKIATHPAACYQEKIDSHYEEGSGHH